MPVRSQRPSPRAGEPIRNPHDIVALWLSVIGGLFVAIVTVMGDYFAIKFPQLAGITHGVTIVVLFGLLYFAIGVYRRAAKERDREDPLAAERVRNKAASHFWYQLAQVLAVLFGGCIVGAGMFLAMATTAVTIDTGLVGAELQAIAAKGQTSLPTAMIERLDAKQNELAAAQGTIPKIVQNALQMTTVLLACAVVLAIAAMAVCVQGWRLDPERP